MLGSCLLLAATLAGPVTAADASPRPVAAWPVGPLEVHVAFDRPVPPQSVQALVGRRIVFGRDVKAGDTPPANSLELLAVPRGTLRIAAAKLGEDRRTLALVTDAHPWTATYALTLPPLASAAAPVPLAYDLQGLTASWVEGASAPEDAEPAWSLWFPALDPASNAKPMMGSVEHERALAALVRPGRLILTGLLSLPAETKQLILTSNVPFQAGLFGELQAAEPTGEGVFSCPLAYEPGPDGAPVDLTVQLPTGAEGRTPGLSATVRSGDAPAKPLDASALLVPWAPGPAPASSSSPPGAEVPDLAGGDPARGEAVFFSEQARCSACHQVRGKGGQVGPALDALAGRDPAAIYRDIADPSVVIHPEYVPFTVATRDGRVAVGVVRAIDADTVQVLDTSANATALPRAEIDQIQPSRTSIMPVGLAGALGPDRMKDLIAYLRGQQAVKP